VALWLAALLLAGLVLQALPTPPRQPFKSRRRTRPCCCTI